MSHYLHKDIGNMIADRWGIYGDDIGSAIANAPIEQCTLSVMIALLHEMRDLYWELVAIKSSINKARTADAHCDNHPFSKLRLLSGDLSFHWDRVPQSGLSVRARTALRRLQDNGYVEVNEELLSDIKGCGEVTKNEIMGWIELGCPIDR